MTIRLGLQIPNFSYGTPVAELFPAVQAQLLFQDFQVLASAPHVAGGASTDTDDVLATGLEVKLAIEGNHSINLTGRNLQFT